MAGCGWSRRTSTALDSGLGGPSRRLPAYTPAQGHLAEVEAALGEHESALARLAPLTVSSDDPDYAAQFARILAESDRTEEARTWLARAAAAYDALVARHPAAYADHAAEFWLTIGTDPEKALCLACTNLALRRTPRARELVTRAAKKFLRGPLAPLRGGGHDP